MKVCLITPWLLNYPPTTGGETLIWTTAFSLTDLNHNVFMFTYDTTREFEGIHEGIPVIAIKAKPDFSLIHRPWLIPFYFSNMIKQLRGISNILLFTSIYYDNLFNNYLERLDCDLIQLEFVGIIPPYKQILLIKRKKNIP